MSKHNAPSVIYPLGRSRLQGQLLGVCWCLGLAVVGFWLFTVHVVGWRQGLALGLLALTGMAAFAGWKNVAVGQLAWDGQHWYWESKGYQEGVASYTVSVACDFQSMMLLRIDNSAHAVLWLWAERRACPERWLDLRRAVYSPHRALSSPLKTAVNPV